MWEHAQLSEKVYMQMSQILPTLYISFVYCRLKMELVEQSGDDRNSLWSGPESQLGWIRQSSVTKGLQWDQKAEVQLSGSSEPPEPMESIRFATRNETKQTYQIYEMHQTYQTVNSKKGMLLRLFLSKTTFKGLYFSQPTIQFKWWPISPAEGGVDTIKMYILRGSVKHHVKIYRD